MSTHTPYNVWGRCHFTKKQLQDGKVKWKNLKCPLGTENCWESMEKQDETGHPVFTSASALSRDTLRTLTGKETIHNNADASNTELLFRIVRSVNQLIRSSFELA